MEVRQNLNIRPEKFHINAIQSPAVPDKIPFSCNFRAALPVNKVCRDVFVKVREEVCASKYIKNAVKKLSQIVSKRLKILFLI